MPTVRAKRPQYAAIAAAARSPSPRARRAVAAEQELLRIPLAILQVLAHQARLKVTSKGYWHRSLPGLVAGWLALAVAVWHRWCVWVTRRCPTELRRTLLSGSVAMHALLLWLGLFFAAVFYIGWHMVLQTFSSPWGLLGSGLLLMTRASPVLAIIFENRGWTRKQIMDATEIIVAMALAVWLLWPTTVGVHVSHAGHVNTSSSGSGLDDNTLGLPDDIELKMLAHFVPPVSSGRVVKVYDGDTITLAAMIPCMSQNPFKFSVRLRGIDTPEMKTKDEDEREAAVIARNAVASMIDGKVVRLVHVTTDKYGRLLADVVVPGHSMSLSEWLIERRHAVAYDGGTKHRPSSWLEYLRREEFH
eukprot:COSAG02_NODE_214_length_28689_cov_34.895523_10_plen_360_part_00